MRGTIRIGGVMALVLAAGTANAGGSLPEVIYSNIFGFNDVVPGGGGIVFASFDRPTGSPDGSRWAMLARNTGATTTDAMILTGAGATGLLRLREGVTEIEPGRVAENMSDRRVGVLNDGIFAYTVNLTGATTDDQVVVVGSDGPGFFIPYREGSPIAVLPGSVGTGISDVNIAANGKTAARFSSLVGTASTQNAAILLDDLSTVGAQRNVTAPGGQVGSEFYNSFAFGSFYINAAGTSFLFKADLNGAAATNTVVVVNNQVVVQEGTTLPGFASPVTNPIVQRMDPSGDWYVRGENADDQAWIVRNGVVVAASGDPVPGGEPGETWSNAVWNVSNGNTFFFHSGNSAGDSIIAGFTSLADTQRNAAWVLLGDHGPQVVLRRGDQVDLNGDGVGDDAYIELTGLNAASLNNRVDAGFLADDGWFYFVADLRRGDGTSLGEAFLRRRVITPPPACFGDANGDGLTNGADLSVLLGQFGQTVSPGSDADFNGDGEVNGADLSVLLSNFGCGS